MSDEYNDGLEFLKKLEHSTNCGSNVKITWTPEGLEYEWRGHPKERYRVTIGSSIHLRDSCECGYRKLEA